MDQGANTNKADGLCGSCTHIEAIRSDRGSIFYKCLLSARDPRLPKYPRLPVLVCPGYANTPGTPEERQFGWTTHRHRQPWCKAIL